MGKGIEDEKATIGQVINGLLELNELEILTQHANPWSC